MTFAIDVFFRPGSNINEDALISQATQSGGHLDFREPAGIDDTSICLTFEFSSLTQAQSTVDILKTNEIHIEGPYEYGN